MQKKLKKTYTRVGVLLLGYFIRVNGRALRRDMDMRFPLVALKGGTLSCLIYVLYYHVPVGVGKGRSESNGLL